MGGPSHRPWRWLWLLVPICLGVILLAGGSRAGVERTAAQAAGESRAASGKLFLPFVRKQAPPQIQLVPFATGFYTSTITDITHAGDERLFVVEREGEIRIVYPDGTIDPVPFLDIVDLVEHDLNWEMGLLGLAFHPDYPAVPYFYIVFTTPAHLQVARVSVSANNPNVADRSSLQVMIRLRKPDASGGPSEVHNAGDLMFGPDGYLYIPIGDGGPDPLDAMGVPGDPNNNSQRRDTLFGSILRIDPDPNRGLPQDCGQGKLYSIPGDNPWLNDDGCDEIWAMGLRNPWRIWIDAPSNEMYIADVGEWQREEFNVWPMSQGGANFGWHCFEGTINYAQQHPELAKNCGPSTNYVFPVHEYAHVQGECSIIGGVVYRGQQYPTMAGRYLFTDFCTGNFFTAFREGGNWKLEPAGETPLPLSAFGTDIHGEMYAGSWEPDVKPEVLYRVVVK